MTGGGTYRGATSVPPTINPASPPATSPPQKRPLAAAGAGDAIKSPSVSTTVAAIARFMARLPPVRRSEAPLPQAELDAAARQVDRERVDGHGTAGRQARREVANAG